LGVFAFWLKRDKWRTLLFGAVTAEATEMSVLLLLLLLLLFM